MFSSLACALNHPTRIPAGRFYSFSAFLFKRSRFTYTGFFRRTTEPVDACWAMNDLFTLTGFKSVIKFTQVYSLIFRLSFSSPARLFPQYSAAYIHTKCPAFITVVIIILLVSSPLYFATTEPHL